MTQVAEETDIEKLHRCSLCLWRMLLVSQAAVCTHFSSLECFLSLTCFTLLLCIYSPPFPPFPNACAQICRLYPRDAEADPGADAGRSLTGLYVVHTHLSEQLYPPPFHFRWVHSCIKSMYTCVTRSLSSVDETSSVHAGHNNRSHRLYCISATYSSKPSFIDISVWAAFSKAKSKGRAACHPKPLILVIIIHHHSPSPGTAT